MDTSDKFFKITSPVAMDVPFQSLADMMFGLMCASANFGFHYHPDYKTGSNIGVIYKPQFKIRTPIGPIYICLSENAPQPKRVLETQTGLVNLPPIILHDNNGVPIHIIYTSRQLEHIHTSISDLVLTVSPQASVLELAEIIESSERYFKALDDYKMNKSA